MPVNQTHNMFPDAFHDEQSRQHFIRSLKVHIAEDIMPANSSLYKNKVIPSFEAKKGRSPKTRKEVREALSREPLNKMWSSMLRTSQEMLYETVRPSIERQLPDLINKGKKKYYSKLGSVKLNPSLKMPKYHTAVDIHSKPGAYHTEIIEKDDITAGAEYDRTIHLYFMGQAGPNNDDMGRSSSNWLRKKFLNFSPKRILDMGCTIGHSTLPYVDEFPNADIFAVDVAAPCIRYAHHRAEALEKKVHFSQQNAEKTNFKDGFFDLIVSHLMMHETSSRAVRNIYKECYRLLSHGGIMMHLDVVGQKDPFSKYFTEWNAHYNAEPYLGTIQDENFKDITSQAGFKTDHFFEDDAVSFYSSRSERGEGKGFGSYHLVGAHKK